MEDILEKLAAHARERVEEKKKISSFSEVRAIAESIPKGWFPFDSAIKKPGLSFICEVKKASPSQGVISEDFPYLDVAKDYEQAGTDAISVLTEPKWFLGSDEYLASISENVRVPILRKDFIVDPYMIYEAKTLGACAVVLICGILTGEEIRDYIELADTVGVSCLVEAHDAYEVDVALKAGARIVCINNRNLKDFSVDTNNAAALRSLVPKNVMFVTESGIGNPEDILKIKSYGADAVLIGEAMMRAHNKKNFLQSLRGAKN